MAKFRIIPRLTRTPTVPARHPIPDDEVMRLFAGLDQAAHSLLAVSGGADSLALLILAVRWRNLGANSDLSVATIDHGMRPEAAAEAAYVAGIAARLGVPHRVLHWRPDDNQDSAIEARARAARYRLLGDHARAIGASHIVTAHHLGDQAETVLMRLAAGSGPAGLAAMRPMRVVDGLFHARPLLDVARERLVAELEASHVEWCEDPMNRDPRFARARLRGSRSILAREGLTERRLGRFAARMARMEDAVEDWAGTHWARYAQISPDEVSFAMEAMAGLPAEIAIRLIARMIAALGGKAPRLERLEAAAEALLAAADGKNPVVRTLGGIRLHAGGGRLSARLAAPRRAGTPSRNPD